MAQNVKKAAEMSDAEYLAYVAEKILKGQRPYPHIAKATSDKPRFEGIRWQKP